MDRYQKKDDIWIPTDQNTFHYSDGDESENYILNAIKQSDDLSIGSQELFTYIKDWPSLYHLSPQRADLLRPIVHLLKDAKVLEVGSGCGAVTRYLAETSKEVIAIEGSVRRAQATAARCRDLENVKVYCDNFSIFQTNEKFDVVTLVGVLEYSNLYIESTDPIMEALKKAKLHLKNEGVLIIAIENQLGLKYFAGAPEDHLGQPFIGIENQYSEKGPITFGKNDIEKRLLNSGFKYVEFLYPFPDYKLPLATITQKGVLDNTINISDLLKNRTKYFQSKVYTPSFDEEKVWPLISKNKLIGDLANSFLIIASCNEEKKIDTEALAYTFSTSYRIKSFCKINKFVFTDSGYWVIKEKCYPNASSDSLLINHHLTNERYRIGSLYINDLEDIVRQKEWTIQMIQEWSKPWIERLISLADKDNYREYQLINGRYFDASPFNIISIDKKSDLVFFDLEWEMKQECRLDFLVFRALYYSFYSIKEISKSSSNPYNYINEIVLDVLHCFFNKNIIDLNYYEEKEKQVLKAIQNLTYESCFDKKVRYCQEGNIANGKKFSEKSDEVKLQFFWKNYKEEFSEQLSLSKSVCLTRVETCTVTFNLPNSMTELESFRFDIGDKPGLINIHEIKVVNDANITLWTWNKNVNEQHDILLVENKFMWPDKIVQVSLSDDPQLIVKTGTELKSLKAQGAVEITISALDHDQLKNLTHSPSILHFWHSNKSEIDLESETKRDLKIDDILKCVFSFNERLNNYESKLAKIILNHNNSIIQFAESMKIKAQESDSKNILISQLCHKIDEQGILINKISEEASKQKEYLQSQLAHATLSEQEQRFRVNNFKEKVQSQQSLLGLLQERLKTVEESLVVNLNQNQELIKIIDSYLSSIDQLNIERRVIVESRQLSDQLSKSKYNEQQLGSKLIELQQQLDASTSLFKVLNEQNLKFRNQSFIGFIKSRLCSKKDTNQIIHYKGNMEKDALQAEIQHLNDQIRWYRDTYENRSLLGIIKDRCLKVFNFKLFKGVTKFDDLTAKKNNDSQLNEKFEFHYEDFIIADQAYFNSEYYYKKHPDVQDAQIDGLEHYILYGWREGRDPSNIFDTNFYLTKYPDVKNAGMCPLVHFAFFGKSEGRIPFPYSDTKPKTQTANEKLGVVPYFHNNYTLITLNESVKSKKIGVHLHLFYIEMAEYFIEKLKNIETPFTLFISVTKEKFIQEIRQLFKSSVSNIEAIEVVCVENKGRDIAPLIITFGNKLLEFDYICHIHSKKSPQYEVAHNWRDDIVDILLGSVSIVNENLNLLNKDGKFIFNEPNINVVLHSQGWCDNKFYAEEILTKYSQIKIDDFDEVNFPQGSMFWAKAEAIQEFLSLPITYTDFPEEPISQDGTICHALERLILVFASQYPGKAYCVYSKNYPDGVSYFEDQEDFSDSQVLDENIKVLSYYLPQFHPTPENDEWHGKGFTEWTKVAAANPLFDGHYQQHVPHDSIGYYHLDSAEVLRKQVEMMKKAKVYGQIFYHYWFTGKLILEKPAQMLLKNKDIEMPFCFCWANENWTRRWDGNENEILLEQKYSQQDAESFIKYLIPFFKDHRYIRIEGRPVLYIYRPASFPDFTEYKETWSKECRKAGIPNLYLVCTLTRGAHSPNEFGMDAAVERVLHDWTAGNCHDKKSQITFFNSFNGTVLDYNDVADYYESKLVKQKDFTLFKSIVPTWDNTARYNDDAYIVYNSTPVRFQKWLSKIIDYSRQNLSENERFVIVNAWNEWAEAAHLEPDSKFGYAYLNSIGRSLSVAEMPLKNIMLGDDKMVPKNLKIWINIHELCTNKFSCVTSKNKMLQSFEKSNIFELHSVSTNNAELYESLKSKKNINYSETGKNCDYTLLFTDLVIFAPDSFENLLKMAMKFPAACILGNCIFKRQYNPFSIEDDFAVKNQMSDYPVRLTDNKSMMRVYKIRIDTMFYLLNDEIDEELETELPIVSTVIRFHKSGKYELLERALFSLATQSSCVVQPMLMLQDIDRKGKDRINQILNKINWNAKYSPIIHEYHSDDQVKDLRSKMLNEGLQKAANKYLTFLDFDDFLYPYAYKWLLFRLRLTNKAITYGHVFATQYNLFYENIVSKNRTYEYGKNYFDFIDKNHSPIHSLMIDLNKINKGEIKYFESQKYMEDYYLTLQIVTDENTDWQSLESKKYIGDYMHFVDQKINSLAVHDDDILHDPEYMDCEEKIHQLRSTIRMKVNNQ